MKKVAEELLEKRFENAGKSDDYQQFEIESLLNLIVVDTSPKKELFKNIERLKETQTFAREKLYYALDLLQLSSASI